VKEEMIEILKKQKSKENDYFKRSDFEHIFDTFDIFDERGTREISKQYLIQALKYINIHYTLDEL
jgi:Ca2+-binding EF-hand superfamily protein